jgi:hypothetical protein
MPYKIKTNYQLLELLKPINIDIHPPTLIWPPDIYSCIYLGVFIEKRYLVCLRKQTCAVFLREVDKQINTLLHNIAIWSSLSICPWLACYDSLYKFIDSSLVLYYQFPLPWNNTISPCLMALQIALQ